MFLNKFIKKISIITILIISGLVFGFSNTFAQSNFNKEINYQGKLTTSTGIAVPDGTYNMRFWLLTSPSIATTSALWTEQLTGSNRIQVTNGLFSVMLGSSTPLTSVDFNQTLYLGVEIGSTTVTALWDGEMSPRKVLGAVPAAFEADNANTVGGVASTSFIRSDIDDTAAGLITFTGGLISSASSTLANLNFTTATGTTLIINGESFTDFTGTALTNNSGVLSVSTSSLATYFASTTAFDTSAELAAILGDETGSAGGGLAVFSVSPTITGTADFVSGDFSSTLTMSGTAANLALGSNWLSGDGDDEGVFVSSTGNVGIGTSSPASKLDVWGNLQVGTSSTPTLFVDSASGKVGIGTSSPVAPLSIQTNNNGSMNFYAQFGEFEFYRNYSTDSDGPLLNFYRSRGTKSSPSAVQANDELFNFTGRGYRGTGGYNASINIVGLAESNFSNSSTPTYLTFSTTPSGATADIERLRINSSGNIGIGTTSPVTKLSVAGSAYIGGNITATGTVDVFATSTLATTTITDLTVTAALRDALGSVGTSGMVLQTTGTSSRWVATSSLNISSGASTLDALTDVDTSGVATGNILAYTGAGWEDFATTTFLMESELDSEGELETLLGGLDVLTISTDDISSANLATALSNETGTGNVVFSDAPTITGTADFVSGDFSSTLTMSGTAANLALGSNWLSGDGDDEGVFVSSTGNVGISTAAPSTTLQVGGGTSSGAQWIRNYGDTSDIFIGQGGNDFFGFSAGTAALIMQDSGEGNDFPLAIGNVNNNSLILGTANTNQMSINSDGYVQMNSTYGLGLSGPLVFSGSAVTSYVTPRTAANVDTKINVPNYAPAAFGQIVAMGVPSTSPTTARVLSLFDDRRVAHQPTLAVFSPDENNLTGFSWDGSNSTSYLKTTGGDIAVRSNVTDIATFSSTGNFGIGTTSPATTLSVAGSAYIGGNLTATGTLSVSATSTFATTTIASSTVGMLNLTNALVALSGGTGLSSVSQNQLLIGGAGNTWTQIATTSLGLLGNSEIDTSAELIAILGDETGSGNLVFSAAPTFTGTTNFANSSHSGNLSVTGTSTLATTTIASSTIGTLNLTNALSAIYGGTGQNTYATGDILYASGAGALTRLAAGGEGTVLKISSGIPSWGSDLSGGSSVWATSTNGLLIYPADTNDVVVIGASATSTTGYIMEVNGNAFFDGVFATAATTSNLTINSERFTDLTGDGLQNSTNVLTVNCADLEGTGIQCDTNNFAIDFSEFDTDSITEGSTNFWGKWGDNFGKLYYDPVTLAYVGIGDNDADYTLEVSSSTDSGYFAISTTADDDGDLFEVDNSGNVGIGDNSPSFKLDVNGTIRATGLATFDSGINVNSESFTDFTGTALTNNSGVLSVSTSSLATYFASTTAFDTSAELAAILGDETGSAGGGLAVFSVSPTITGTADFVSGDFSSTLTMSGTAANLALGSNWLSGDGDDEGVFVSSTGNVGIGTSSPASKLDVWGNLQVGTSSTPTLFVNSGNGNVGIGTNTPQARLSIGVTSLTGNGVAGIDSFYTLTNTASGSVQYGEKGYILNSGTATTTIVGGILRLEDSTTFGNTVRGFEVQAHRGTNTQGENTALSGFARTFGVRGKTEGDAGGLFEPAGGFFETGGSTQGNAIRGYSASITTSDLLSLFQDTSAFAGTGLLMNFGNSGGSFSSTTSKFVDFQNAGTSKFTVTAQGTTTIGDGTTNNQAGLQIGYGGLCVDNDGTCNASTTGRISSVSTYAGNSDLAEMYFSSDSLLPGEIVVTDGFLSVRRATQDTKERVLGVISTKPGLLLGYDDSSLIAGQKGYPLALSGRVPVRLSNENGPVSAGDPLTLSSLPGVAMKATDADMIVGYALENYDGTHAYTEGFVDQFGDDIAEPNYEAININTEHLLKGNCHFGGGVATGEIEPDCEPVDLDAIAEEQEQQEDLARARFEAEQAALQRLLNKSADAVYTASGTVQVGQIIMFVDRGYYQSANQTGILNELVSTSTDLVLGAEDNSGETLWSRLKLIAQGFVDGVLTIAGIKTEKVETSELCVDDVCINAVELRALLESSNNQGQVVDVDVHEEDVVVEDYREQTNSNNTTVSGDLVEVETASGSVSDVGSTTSSETEVVEDTTVLESDQNLGTVTLDQSEEVSAVETEIEVAPEPESEDVPEPPVIEHEPPLNHFIE